MTDIVERLRNGPTTSDLYAAANEIERLRAALRKICEPITVAADAETVGACQDLHELICVQARAALGEAKDE